jgi:hypothetical protein
VQNIFAVTGQNILLLLPFVRYYATSAKTGCADVVSIGASLTKAPHWEAQWLPQRVLHVPTRDARKTRSLLFAERSLNESKSQQWTTIAQSAFSSKIEPISVSMLNRSCGSRLIFPTGKLTTTDASNAGHLSAQNDDSSNLNTEPAERRVSASGLAYGGDGGDDLGEVGAPPWIANPNQLVSWWDMKDFPILNLLQLVRAFEEGVHRSADDERQVDAETVKESVVGLDQRIAECMECSLPSTADGFKRMKDSLEGGTTWKGMGVIATEVMNRLEDECRRKIVMAIDPDNVKYFSNAQFFDSKDATAKKVSVEFPSANEDIAEAGKCLACGRSTACVMHLNRVAEVGLRALAKALNVPEQNDWGKYLQGIDTELQKRMKSSGVRTSDEQFYAEASITFDGVRRAWRNPTMHVDKTYTSERAEEILVAVRSFMRHLATKLHD